MKMIVFFNFLIFIFALSFYGYLHIYNTPDDTHVINFFVPEYLASEFDRGVLPSMRLVGDEQVMMNEAITISIDY